MLGASGSAVSLCSDDDRCLHQTTGYSGEDEEPSGSEYYFITSPKDHGDIRGAQADKDAPRSSERPLITARRTIQPDTFRVLPYSADDEQHTDVHNTAGPPWHVGSRTQRPFPGSSRRDSPNEARSARYSLKDSSPRHNSFDSFRPQKFVDEPHRKRSSTFSWLANSRLGKIIPCFLFSPCRSRGPAGYMSILPRDADSPPVHHPIPHPQSRSGELLMLVAVAVAIALSLLRFFISPLHPGVSCSKFSAAEIAYHEIDQEMIRFGFLKANDSPRSETVGVGYLPSTWKTAGMMTQLGSFLANVFHGSSGTSESKDEQTYFDTERGDLGSMRIPYFGTLDDQESFGERDIDLGLLDLKLFEANPIPNVYLTSKTRRAEFHRRSCSGYPEIRIHLGSEDLRLFSKYLMIQRSRWPKLIFENFIALLRLSGSTPQWSLASREKNDDPTRPLSQLFSSRFNAPDAAVWASHLNYPLFSSQQLEESSEAVAEFIGPFVPFRFFEYGVSGTTAQVPGFAAEMYSVESDNEVCSAVRSDPRVACLAQKNVLTVYCPVLEDGRESVVHSTNSSSERFLSRVDEAGGISDGSPHANFVERSTADGEENDLRGRTPSSGHIDRVLPTTDRITEYLRVIDRPVQAWLEGLGLSIFDGNQLNIMINHKHATEHATVSVSNPTSSEDDEHGFITPFYGMIYINGEYPICSLLYSMRYLAPWSIIVLHDGPKPIPLDLLSRYFNVVESHIDPPIAVAGRRQLVDRTISILRMKPTLTRREILYSYLNFLP